MTSGWRKPSFSIGNGACVEVARGTDVLVRDTTDRGGTVLAFPPAAWKAFTGRMRGYPCCSHCMCWPKAGHPLSCPLCQDKDS